MKIYGQKQVRRWAALAAVCILTSCSTPETGSHGPVTLKEAFKHDFLMGVAINASQFSDTDQRGDPIIKAQFNAISPENVLKWEIVHPSPDTFNFDPGDRYVAFGESNHMAIIGHTLVWHSQTPGWVFRDASGKPLTRDALLERMSNHIHTVVGRYKGRIKGWDVVNEALNENGTLRQSQWLRIIGDDYIAKAFQFAHEADPNAELHYNDYSLEHTNKRAGAIALIKKLKAEGVPITAIGLQGHMKMDWPTAQEEDETISDFAKLGVKVMITELDVDVSLATQRNRSADVALNGQGVTPGTATNDVPANVNDILVKRYGELFGVFVKHHRDIERVTLWGVTDGDSWLNRGRSNYPLLFDRQGNPKPAFDAVVATAHGH